MKHNLYASTNKLASQLNSDYQSLYEQLLENVIDEQYTKHEINFFLRKSIKNMLAAQEKQTPIKDYAGSNKKKWAVSENKTYKQWHERYNEKMKECDRITYVGFFAMVAYSLTLIALTAYTKGAMNSWLWIALPTIVTLALLIVKILLARKLKLQIVHTYGDILMFALITAVCYFANVYFIIFLWVYEVAYMLFLQFHVVEEDI